MDIEYRNAKIEDAELLVEIYNLAFEEDYLEYGFCPGYCISIEKMKDSMNHLSKIIIINENIEVGAISIENRGRGNYYLGCLCIVPEHQRKGIGELAIKYIIDYYKDCQEITLTTPKNKEKNIRFYTEKCGFEIYDEEIDNGVELVKLKKSTK